MSILIFITLILGILSGMYLPENISSFVSGLSDIMLWLLIFSVGIDIGLNKEVFDKIKKLGVKILLIPFGIIIGSFIGGAVVSIFVSNSIKECLAISSGLGWYSLSGVIISNAGNPTAGTISFLANIMREMITFITVPIIAKYINYYCVIAPAGATAMDTTLPIISKTTNGKIAVIAFISGIVLTMLVPILVPVFL